MSGLSVFRLVGNVSVQNGVGVAELATVGLPASTIRTGRFTNARMPLDPSFEGTMTVQGHVLPAANVTYDLGSASMRWKDLYLAGNTVYLGDTVLSAGEVAGTMRVHAVADPGNTAAIVLTQTAATVAGNAVAVGTGAGQTSQGSSSVAVGYLAGIDSQGNSSVAVGYWAGHLNQGSCSVAIGRSAGFNSQGSYATAFGERAGQSNQGGFSTAVGHAAGLTGQGNRAVAIGANAGQTAQGNNAIAIGTYAGQTNQAANCIVINATGGTLNNTTANSCVIAPVRDYASIARRVALYDSGSGEFSTSSTNFVVDASNRVGIGTAAPQTRLHVGDNAVTGLSGLPGSGDANALLVGHPTATGTSVLNDPKRVLYLTRLGTVGQAYGSAASFSLCRWENNSVNSRTRMDIGLTHAGTYQDSDLTTVMSIRSDGNVGIGTTAPAYTLDVNGTARITSNLFFNDQIQNNMITLYGSTALNSTTSYGFGINSVTLRYNIPSGQFHRWYAGTTNIMTLTGTGNLTITGTYSPSDRRIKTAIRDLDDAEALETLRRLKPVAYGYVDPEGRGVAADTEVIGFIAQDVAEVLPHAAVTTNTAFVPSVFAPATRISSSPDSTTMVFSLDQKEIPFGPGARVQIFWHEDGEGRKDAVVRCVSVPTPTSFECDPEPGSLDIPDDITVIGHEVDDFHTLKKDVIFTVVTAATQELDRQLQAAKAETESLRAETESLRTTLESVLARLAALEGAV